MAKPAGIGKGSNMPQVTYEVIEQDGGWAYKMGSTISETYPTRVLAHTAAARAAGEQKTPGEDEAIAYEDSSGEWREEEARGAARGGRKGLRARGAGLATSLLSVGPHGRARRGPSV